jgi:GntR family transcriptional regulator
MTIPGPIPLYHQVATVLRRRIVDGEYRSGPALPSEENLCAEFEVSRPTIRQAVGELVQAGLLERRRGSGTYLSHAAGRIVGHMVRGSMADLLTKSPRTVITVVSIETKRPLPPRIAELISLPEGLGTVIVMEIVTEDRPFGHTIRYLPDKYGALIDSKALRAETTLGALHSKGIMVKGATQTIRAQAADVEVSNRLALAFGTPVLFIERLSYGKRREPIELVQTWYRSDVYEYIVQFDLADGKFELAHDIRHADK